MIDNNLLNAYLQELEALRVHGKEFAEAFPDVAGRLDIGSRRSLDPQVERVVESSAFLAARIRMMVEHQSAELPRALLSMLAPTLTEPVPAMAILELRGGSEAQAVPRDTKFDHSFGGQALVSFTTTMDCVAAPVRLRLRRLEPEGNYADGISVRLVGQPPPRLDFYLGNNAANAAALMDALDEDLVVVEVVQPNGGDILRLPPGRLTMRGFAPEDASLPARPGVHPAHRLVTEFIAFPEKFRFASLTEPALRAGAELRFRFARPLPLLQGIPDDLITVNRVPAVNLWAASATPFDISGRQLEYPVRVDAQRYRIVECQSVEEVHMYGPGGDRPVRLDPMLATGDILNTEVRWGVRRTTSRAGAEVMLYFQGLDYRTLGQQTYLAAPRVLASNGDLARRGRVGDPVLPAEGLGDWGAALATVPTAYRPALAQPDPMQSLLEYMQSSLSSLTSANRAGLLRQYLRQFPGAETATWIDALGPPSVRSQVALRGGAPQVATRAVVPFASDRAQTTSRRALASVLAALFDSQRGLNQVEEVRVVGR